MDVDFKVKNEGVFMRKLFLFVIALLLVGSICVLGDDADEATRWVASEMTFTSDRDYDNPFYDVDFDVIFTHEETGYVLEVPGFWDGGRTFKVRYALTKTGEWSYVTICSDKSNTGLHDKTGEIKCVEYEGELEIYKRGFVKTDPNLRYFVYDDGTPFFYLGDTHWFLGEEDMSSPESMFYAIVDHRVKQRFTVYQSEPLGAPYNLADGFSSADLVGFWNLDAKFKYIADSGLVHANSQLFHVTELMKYYNPIYDDEYLDRLCRYWVARYSAYPVLWTTAQESDNDFYYERGDSIFDAENNRWVKVAEFTHKHDPYKHPLTAHMEHTSFCIASGSSFRDLEGHTWYGAQFSFNYDTPMPWDIVKDYWENGQGKVIVNYEGKYDHLWTMTFGARAQGWIAFLNGMYGYGYGAQGIWDDWFNNEDSYDGRDIIKPEDKMVTWQEALKFPSGDQMTIMRSFFEEYEWYNLIPRFDNPEYISGESSYKNKYKDLVKFKNTQYSLASIDNDLYILYLFNDSMFSATLKGLDNTIYSVKWFNPRTGEYSKEKNVFIFNRKYNIGAKPDYEDWVLVVEKKTYISFYMLIALMLVAVTQITRQVRRKRK